jgi:hypothetical protein
MKYVSIFLKKEEQTGSARILSAFLPVLPTLDRTFRLVRRKNSTAGKKTLKILGSYYLKKLS